MAPRVHNFFRKSSFAGKRREAAPVTAKRDTWEPTHSFDSETASNVLNEHHKDDSELATGTAASEARLNLKARCSTSPELRSDLERQQQRHRHTSSFDHSAHLTAFSTPNSMCTKTSTTPVEPGSQNTASTKSSHSSEGSRRRRRMDVIIHDKPNNNQASTRTNTNTNVSVSSSQTAHNPRDVGSPVSALSNSFSKPRHPLQAMWYSAQSAFHCRDDTTISSPKEESYKINNSRFMDYMEDVCSPCRPRSLEDSYSKGKHQRYWQDEESSQLGIARMEPPVTQHEQRQQKQQQQHEQSKPQEHLDEKKEEEDLGSIASLNCSSVTRQNLNQAGSSDTVDTPIERRRERHRRQLLRLMPPRTKEQSQMELMGVKDDVEVTPTEVICKEKVTGSGSVSNASCKKQKSTPLNTLTVKTEEAEALERSISELTMRSSYGEATAKLAENRRMAYYAVGKHHRTSGRGGNRRCYFTGKLILGGAPFYAGSVQQGLRTLVVFCLPSAVGLPKGVDLNRDGSLHSLTPSSAQSTAAESSKSITRLRIPRSEGSSATHSIGVNVSQQRSSILSRKRSGMSRLSSVDDMSMSIEEEMDPNWGLDRDYLLSVLPVPKQELLDEMATRYPAQFETLPVQVRSPHCWRLYVKFCFFSGLPIAEGEMHYKVCDEICETYGEEIILSHEVMEAVNGESAEILRLPNLKTFRYLRRHYSQQSGKLPEDVFLRQSWELVRPEV